MKSFRWFFGKFRTSKSHSEINWPLKINIISTNCEFELPTKCLLLIIGGSTKWHLNSILPFVFILSSYEIIKQSLTMRLIEHVFVSFENPLVLNNSLKVVHICIVSKFLKLVYRWQHSTWSQHFLYFFTTHHKISKTYICS
jgi:hypothetical protein